MVGKAGKFVSTIKDNRCCICDVTYPHQHTAEEVSEAARAKTVEKLVEAARAKTEEKLVEATRAKIEAQARVLDLTQQLQRLQSMLDLIVVVASDTQ